MLQFSFVFPFKCQEIKIVINKLLAVELVQMLRLNNNFVSNYNNNETKPDNKKWVSKAVLFNQEKAKE
jgi:hypothetical protein